MKNPEIRFIDDNIDWQENSLGNMGKTFNGLTGKTKNDFGHGIAKYITYMNVYKNTIALPNEIDSIEIDNSQNQVIYGDILFTVSSETPEEVGLSSVWLYNENNVYLNSFCFGYRPSNNIDHKFMGYLLRSNSIRKKIILLAQGISRYNISKNKVIEIKISLPSLEIQKQISSLLSDIDQKISSQEILIQKLKDTKSALLIKMFPHENQSAPELRFDGFTNAWEQRKLGIESIITAGGDIDKSKVVNNGTFPIYANALTNDGIVGFYNDTYKIKAPAVTVTGRGEIGHAKARSVNFTPVVRLLTIQSKHNIYFLENIINNHKVIVESTGVPQLTIPQLSNYNISFPHNIGEEIKIGNLFNTLDNLITLHQCKSFHLNFSL